jgi:ABC-2 type transport system permease protein
MTSRGFDYRQLLPPTIVAQAMLFCGMSSAYYVAGDRLTGFSARLRALPIHRAAPQVGRSIGDLARAALSLAVVIGVGVLSGMRFRAGWGGFVGFVVVALAFALATSLAMGLLGHVASSPSAAVSMASVPYLPLLMLSSGFAPVDDFPGWLQPFVEWQPVTCVIDALRALAGDGDIVATVGPALAWSGGVAVVSAALGARAGRVAP